MTEDNAADHFTYKEIWTQPEIDLYWEWTEVWYDKDFNFETDLSDTGEDILAKAERIGPPHPSTRPGQDDSDDWPTGSYVIW